MVKFLQMSSTWKNSNSVTGKKHEDTLDRPPGIPEANGLKFNNASKR